ncbi:MAG: hypothetical protein HKN52_09785 [Eudoraea sp.]|nr:hypothetical protein [Eudoraea sp.]
MKSRILASFLVTALLCIGTSCSDDSSDEDNGLSQEQLDATTGLYNLTEYIVSPAQDLNLDQVSSENLLEELPCLSASIILRDDLTFSLFQVELDISFITGPQYAIFCSNSTTTTGFWDLQNNQIVLSQGEDGTYILNGTTLTRNEGNNLPDFQRLVFEKQ